MESLRFTQRAHRALLRYAVVTVIGSAVCVPTWATTRTITATIVGMSVTAAYPETTLFQISPIPAATACVLGNNGWFAFSPATIADAQTRKNFVVFVVTAKSQGSSVLLVYDDAGGCDPFGYPAPSQIVVH